MLFYVYFAVLVVVVVVVCAVQDVRAVRGKLSASGEPLIRLERAAMIHFGVPSFGVHLNGYIAPEGTRYIPCCEVLMRQGCAAGLFSTPALGLNSAPYLLWYVFRNQL